MAGRRSPRERPTTVRRPLRALRGRRRGRALNINPVGHTRLPRYARGKRGRVEKGSRRFRLPRRQRPRPRPEPAVALSRVFTGAELWGRDADQGLDVSIDAWESYLERRGMMATSPPVARDNEEPIFNEAWEAQAFAIVVALHEAKLFRWSEWTAALSREIAAASGSSGPGADDLLSALARCARSSHRRKGRSDPRRLGCPQGRLGARSGATPHGEPILLSSDPGPQRSGLSGDMREPDERSPRRVVLFSGHMIDAPGREKPRFPPDREPIAAVPSLPRLRISASGPMILPFAVARAVAISCSRKPRARAAPGLSSTFRSKSRRSLKVGRVRRPRLARPVSPPKHAPTCVLRPASLAQRKRARTRTSATTAGCWAPPCGSARTRLTSFASGTARAATGRWHAPYDGGSPREGRTRSLAGHDEALNEPARTASRVPDDGGRRWRFVL